MSALAPIPLVEASDLDLVASTNFGFGASFVLGVLLLVCGVGASLGALFAHARTLVARGKREADAIARPGPLFAGPSKVVRGRVSLAQGTRPAVRVVIKQTVKNHTSKNSKWHTWEETERAIEAHSFYLTPLDEAPGDDRGEAILVEPSDNVFVVDEIETRDVPGAIGQRVRVCEVSEGEVFSAYGTLVRGAHPRGRATYRDSEQGWILKPPRTGKMVLASETIDARYSKRASFVRTWTAVLTVAWALFNGIFAVPFLAAAAFGEHEIAEVTSFRTWVTRSKNSTTTHYAVNVLTESGHRFEREVSGRTYYGLERLHVATGVRVPVVQAFEWESASYLGDHPTMNGIVLFIGLTAAGLSAGFFYSGYRGAYAWYDKRRLSEQGGKGHIP